MKKEPRIERSEYDWTVLFLAVCLTALGIVMVYSSSTEMAATLKRYQDDFYFLKRQIIFASVGFGLMALLMRIDYHRWRKLAIPGLFLSVFLLIAVFIPGIGGKAGGASRWLRVGFNLQPGELAKLALIIYMAHSLTKKQDKIQDVKKLMPYMVILGVVIVLLLMQPDMGTAAILVTVATLMIIVAGMRRNHIGWLIGILAPSAVVLVMTSNYRLKRVLAFLNPWEDPTGKGFQIIQSWIAVGSGGFFGKGLGEGRQKLFYLPEAHTDFILSVIGEELGFLGVFTVAVLFIFLVVRGMRIALSAPDDFGRYLAFGITVLLGLEAFTNMLVVLGMLPTKGLALPFLSYGGSSLLCTLAAVGILLNISSQTGTGQQTGPTVREARG